MRAGDKASSHTVYSLASQKNGIHVPVATSAEQVPFLRSRHCGMPGETFVWDCIKFVVKQQQKSKITSVCGSIQRCSLVRMLAKT